MVTATVSLVDFLDDLLNRKSLAPKVDAYLQGKMRNYPDSWYNKILKKDGQEVAEKALAEWVEERHLCKFSEAIRPAVVGLKDLAEADKDGKYVKLVRTSDDGSTFTSRRFGLNTQLLIAFNPEHHGCGCDTPEGYWAFGLNGTLGLKAVVLGCSTTEEVMLGLVFPNRDKEADPNGNGFTMICLDLEGHLDNHSLSPHFYKDGFLKQSLGLTSMDEAVSIFTIAGGSDDVCMGFPGSADYLAKHIGTLGTYLSSTATKLRSHKTKKH